MRLNALDGERVSGATNYFVFQQPFLKRCDVDGQGLKCEELKEFESNRGTRGGGGGASGEGAGAGGSQGSKETPKEAPKETPKK